MTTRFYARLAPVRAGRLHLRGQISLFVLLRDAGGPVHLLPARIRGLLGPPANAVQRIWVAGHQLSAASRFAAVGALGTLVNLGVMALLVHGVFDISYLLASFIAAEVSILHNFVLQERFVFQTGRGSSKSRWTRLVQHLLFNNAESLLRMPLLVLLVDTAQMWAVPAQALTLAVSFLARFLFASRVVYRGGRS